MEITENDYLIKWQIRNTAEVIGPVEAEQECRLWAMRGHWQVCVTGRIPLAVEECEIGFAGGGTASLV
jgi:hypothetical protein